MRFSSLGIGRVDNILAPNILLHKEYFSPRLFDQEAFEIGEVTGPTFDHIKARERFQLVTYFAKITHTTYNHEY